jgi:adenine deaminase
MGLMSDAGYEKVNETLHCMIQKAHAMGVAANVEPFISLSFMALAVIPEIRITARGIYDVVHSKLI